MLTPLGFSLLRQLADGEFHSGEDLADKVGVMLARDISALADPLAAALASHGHFRDARSAAVAASERIRSTASVTTSTRRSTN